MGKYLKFVFLLFWFLKIYQFIKIHDTKFSDFPRIENDFKNTKKIFLKNKFTKDHKNKEILKFVNNNSSNSVKQIAHNKYDKIKKKNELFISKEKEMKNVELL